MRDAVVPKASGFPAVAQAERSGAIVRQQNSLPLWLREGQEFAIAFSGPGTEQRHHRRSAAPRYCVVVACDQPVLVAMVAADADTVTFQSTGTCNARLWIS